VRGYFLKTMTAQEDSDRSGTGRSWLRALSSVVGARTVNMLFRKLEEIRLSLWIEERDAGAFGSKRPRQGRNPGPIRQPDLYGERPVRVREGGGILFWPAASPLSKPPADAGKAALLAGNREVGSLLHAPNASQTRRVLERRNQILVAHAARGFISPDQARGASRRPLRRSRSTR